MKDNRPYKDYRKSKQRFLLGIPTINRADLLNEALEKYMYQDGFVYDILIIDNGNQKIITRDDHFEIYRPKTNIGVASSWNLICNQAYALGYQQALILNDDVYLGKKREEVETLIQENYSKDLMYSTKKFSSFIIRIDSFLQYGTFDEQFYPAYFEDNDYLYRLKLRLASVKKTEELDPLVYRNSMSIKKDIELNSNFALNEKKYIAKWGGLPNQEKFDYPYNDESNRFF